jgi:DNA polymerase-1
MKKLYLVDVSSMIFRAFYAIRPLTNPSGLPVNALYGFISMTVKLLREIRPDYMAFCFDQSEETFRKELDPRYKANRKEMPEDLVPQMPYFRRVSEALGIPCLDVARYEADDIIGSLTCLGRDHGLEVVIVSSDKDFAQLVKPYVSMYDTMKDVRYDVDGVIQKWGVEPRKMIDYLAIVGDASDNVTGVKGIGEKGAQKLLAQYDSLEDIYAHIDEITGATQKKLIASKDEAFLAKKLVTIVCDMSLGVQPEELRLKPIHREELSALLAELDFKTFHKTLLGEALGTSPGSAVAASTAALAAPEQAGSIDAPGSGASARPQSTPLGGAPSSTPLAGAMSGAPKSTPLSGSASRFVRAAGTPSSNGSVVGVGTTGAVGAGGMGAAVVRGELRTDGHVEGSVSHLLNPNGHEKTIVKSGLVPSAPGIPTASIPIGEITETRLDLAGLAKFLRPEAETWAIHTERATYLAQSPSRPPVDDPSNSGAKWTIAEVAANAEELGELLTEKKLRYKGFDVKTFAKTNFIRKIAVVWDQMLAAYVVKAAPIEDVRVLFATYNGESLPELPTPTQILTAHLQLEVQLRSKVRSINGEKILFEIEQPLVPILLSMEQAGILIDVKDLARQSETLVKDIAVLEKEIHALAGDTFNIGSTKQLGSLLFDKLKMPVGKKTKTGYSTDTDVLQKLAGQFPIAGKVLQWRELSKLRSTYVDALPLLVDKKTGRIHTTFNQATTSTGRLSSVTPNLQNIPIRTERGNKVRGAFIADNGKSLISADYSQIELRILAHITNDPGLTRAFEQGLDIHAATASEVFDVPLKDVTPEMRRKAKAVNFGLAYGQGAFGLADVLQISRKEATDIIARYFSRFSNVQSYMTDTVEEAKKKGYVETIFGRRRYLDELYSASPMIRKFGERAAINAPIQGTASDLVKMAMIQVGQNPKGAQMLLQVHDELVFEADEASAKDIGQSVAAKMEGIAKLNVPLRVNVGIGKSWLEAH